MKTSQLQAEHMAKKHGIIHALEDARCFVRINDRAKRDLQARRDFWLEVIAWLERYAVQAAAMHELD